jgi:hypothetical protein
VELLPLLLARLLVERAIYKISSFQNIRSARFILARPKHTKATKVSDIDISKLLNFVFFVAFVVKFACFSWLRLCRARSFGVSTFYAIDTSTLTSIR